MEGSKRSQKLLLPEDGSTGHGVWICRKGQSWAHRCYKLSERSKAMSDLWFSEWRKMSVELWANCPKKEFAHRSKRSLNLKERAFWAVHSLSNVSMLSFCLHSFFFFTIVKNNPLHLLPVRPPPRMGWFSKKISLPLSLINTYHRNLILARSISKYSIFKKTWIFS